MSFLYITSHLDRKVTINVVADLHQWKNAHRVLRGAWEEQNTKDVALDPCQAF